MEVEAVPTELLNPRVVSLLQKTSVEAFSGKSNVKFSIANNSQ